MINDSRVAVVADSTSDIPAELARDLGVEIVPLLVQFGEETFHDGELTQAQFFERMSAAPELPTTGTPGVGAFADAYERALQHAESVVSIHISSGLSGTIEAARQAAAQFGDRVHVFDSLNLSWGLGWQVVEAARAAQAGGAVADVLAAAERTRERVRMIVGLDKLDNLAKGGRIGAVSAFLGGLLDLKITLTVTDKGVFEPVARARGAKAAVRGTMEWIGEQMKGATTGAFCVMHALSAERAEELRRAIEDAYEVTEMHVVEVGVVIATHTGTGWGVAVVPAD